MQDARGWDLSHRLSAVLGGGELVQNTHLFAARSAEPRRVQGGLCKSLQVHRGAADQLGQLHTGGSSRRCGAEAASGGGVLIRSRVEVPDVSGAHFDGAASSVHDGIDAIASDLNPHHLLLEGADDGVGGYEGDLSSAPIADDQVGRVLWREKRRDDEQGAH